jgi:hypothetical protein
VGCNCAFLRDCAWFEPWVKVVMIVALPWSLLGEIFFRVISLWGELDKILCFSEKRSQGRAKIIFD